MYKMHNNSFYLHAAGCGKEHEGTDSPAFFTDLRSKFPADALALALLDDYVPKWLPMRLKRQIKDALRGLERDMALEVANDVVEALTYGLRNYTGIPHIDRLLYSLYNKIEHAARKKGIKTLLIKKSF